MTYPIFDEATTEESLPYSRLADEIARVLREASAGEIRIAERTALPLARGTLLCMPASDERLTITKIVTVHPGNTGGPLPTISGEVIVADAATGRRLGLLHGGAVTRRRTAALSLLAARQLLTDRQSPAADGAGERSAPLTLLIFGAGDQALGHGEAFSEGLRGLRGSLRVLIASRTPERVASLVARLGARGVAAAVCDDPEAALADADIVVTATTSRTPVVTSAPRAGALVCAVGAFRHDMAELSPAVVGGADRVVVDTLAGAKAEAGDLIQAVAAGAWRWEAAEQLLDVLAAAGGSSSPPRGSAVTRVPARGQYNVFKSVGHAMYDLAAARVAFPEGAP